ncbi:MAG: HU family DNA-binding protein [Alphaproteobacteria bacterium]
MNRTDVVNDVAVAAGLTKVDASKAVDAILNAITDALKDGDDVRLTGFGTFTVTERAAGVGRNPRTGEKIAIAASKTAKFSASKKLKDVLNG